MSNALERQRSANSLVSGGGRGSLPISRRTSRALAARQEQALLRAGDVQLEEYVQTEKLKAVDHLAREAATGHALLTQWISTVAQGDPMVGDELRFFSDIARLGKGEIIADTIDTYTRGM